MNERMNRKKLNIGTYILEPYARSEANVKALADCGIDFVTCMDYDPDALKLFAKYGVGASVRGILPGWWGGDGDNAGNLEKAIPLAALEEARKKFTDMPAIWGIDCGDEPSALDFGYYGKLIDYVDHAFEHQFPYLNLYPNYASVAQNSASARVSQLGTPTYAEHIAQYVEKVPTDYVCYDHYMYSCNIPGAYENLRIVADACRASKRSLWIVLQCNSSDPKVWMSENMLRHQAYSAMAFGAETIIWACWTAGWWHNQILDDKGEKTIEYDRLKDVNAELIGLGERYMRYRNVSTDLLGFENDRAIADKVGQKPVKKLDAGAFRNIRSDGINAIVGHMTARSGDGEAFFVCDAADPYDKSPLSYRVYFECSGDRVPHATINGKATELRREGSAWSVPMKSCCGALVELD
jgi:hypothetical protein